MHRKVRLLNVDVDDTTIDELVETFRQGVMLTLHVDSIMKLQNDREFYRLLPRFDVVTCDSQILIVAARLLGTPLKERVSGSDYFPRFYSRYKDDASVTVFICGGDSGIAESARRNVNAKVGRQMVVGTNAPSRDYDRQPDEIERIIAQINESGATVLVVGLGGGRQEKFIFRYRDRLPGVKLFLPLGGTIDYEAKSLKRPPAWVTNAGLEWLYRVMREPRQRWRRYFVHQPPFLYLLARQLIGVYKDPFPDTQKNTHQA
ncbi:MAG TPA: WecB/TagA/CpsF family glycosyltransferase [Xanthobacteraceae bacterium]|nr:WecB/TagA/CpsF family glycosyltransferase [Xanthobacteraceae bacterium]